MMKNLFKYWKRKKKWSEKIFFYSQGEKFSNGCGRSVDADMLVLPHGHLHLLLWQVDKETAITKVGRELVRIKVDGNSPVLRKGFEAPVTKGIGQILGDVLLLTLERKRDVMSTNGKRSTILYRNREAIVLD